MTAATRALIRACAAICEARGRADLAVRLLDLIPEPCKHHSPDWGGACMRCGETVFTRERGDSIPKETP